MRRYNYTDNLSPDVIKTHRDSEFDKQLSIRSMIMKIENVNSFPLNNGSHEKELRELNKRLAYSCSLMQAYDFVLADKIRASEAREGNLITVGDYSVLFPTPVMGYRVKTNQ